MAEVLPFPSKFDPFNTERGSLGIPDMSEQQQCDVINATREGHQKATHATTPPPKEPKVFDDQGMGMQSKAHPFLDKSVQHQGNPESPVVSERIEMDPEVAENNKELQLSKRNEKQKKLQAQMQLSNSSAPTFSP